MVKGLEGLLVFSEDATKLADFYKNTIGLKCTNEAEVGEEGKESKVFFFEAEGRATLAIMGHSEVHGRNNDPSRLVFNLEVDNMEAEVKKLTEAEVKKISETYHVEGYGLITTFEDLDGNYFQLVQTKESAS